MSFWRRPRKLVIRAPRFQPRHDLLIGYPGGIGAILIERIVDVGHLPGVEIDIASFAREALLRFVSRANAASFSLTYGLSRTVTVVLVAI
jgi:hypothetical protein